MDTTNILNEVVLKNIPEKSWICNYLKNKGIISQEQFIILSAFGAWVAEQYPVVMKCYWSYLDKLMKKFNRVETNENAKKIFIPWVEETISFIKSGQNNRAYFSFCLMVIGLTEKYNNNHQMFTKEELDTYLGIKKSIENSRRYSSYDF